MSQGHETLKLRFAIAREFQPSGASYPTVDTIPIDLARVLPICFSCHRDYFLPEDSRVVGMLLNRSFIDWENAIGQFLEHQQRHNESSHGTIVEQVDHRLTLFNAGVLYQRP